MSSKRGTITRSIELINKITELIRSKKSFLSGKTYSTLLDKLDILGYDDNGKVRRTNKRLEEFLEVVTALSPEKKTLAKAKSDIKIKKAFNKLIKKKEEEKKEEEKKEELAIEMKIERERTKILIKDDNIIHAKVNDTLPLLIKEFTTKKFTNDEINTLLDDSRVEIKGLNILDEIESDQQVKVLFKTEIYTLYDEEPADIPVVEFSSNKNKSNFGAENNRSTRYHEWSDTIAPVNITDDYIRQHIYEQFPYLRPDIEEGTQRNVNINKIGYISVIITSLWNPDDPFIKVNMKLRDSAPLKIFNEQLDDVYETNNDENCVRKYLLKVWPKISKKMINNLGTKDGISTEELYEFCKSKEIKMIAYDIAGNVIKSYYPNKQSRSYKSISFIAYNNHIYPLKNKYLKKISAYTTKYEIIENGLDRLLEFINNGILPLDIKTSKIIDLNKNVNITSFCVNDTKYICNEEYETCKTILSSFGLQDRIYDTIKINALGDIISKLYETGYNSDSFFPDAKKFVHGGATFSTSRYNADEIMKMKELGLLHTEDKNKCYSTALKDLDSLITIDFRQAKHTLYENDDGSVGYEATERTINSLKDNYLYIAAPLESSLLLENNNCYTGKHLKFAFKYGLKFIIREELQTNTIPNIYRQMVIDIYNKVENKAAKRIMNIFMGNMERDSPIKKNYEVVNVFNNEESKGTRGFPIKLNEHYNLHVDEVTRFSIYNKKPINIQIKEEARRKVFLRMIEHGLVEDQIIQLKTDSITFINSDKKMIENSNDLDAWKQEEFKMFKTKIMRRRIDKSFMTIPGNASYMGPERQLYNCYAGVGKTHKILNEIIPKINDSYIVLTPSHSTLETYKKNNINCKVIQTYFFNKTIPSERTIIIDECGLMDRKANDLLYKCYLLNKNIYCLGDFKQLLPVGENSHFNSPQYLNLIFGNRQNVMNTNMRNNFSIDYYNTIINNKLCNYDTSLSKEVHKHEQNNFYDSDIVICYRNETVKKYNDLILKHKDKKDMFFIGSKLRCTSNRLYQYDIFNNFYLYINDINGDNVTLSNDVTLDKNTIKRYFVPGYAVTLYGAQGRGYKSYYYAPEDDGFIDGRSAYTIISRLQTKNIN